jgi:hypothetical protein
MCSDLPGGIRIGPNMTILEIVSLHPRTEAVFKEYDIQAGLCLCCQAFFEPLCETTEKFGLNLELLLDDINKAVS